MVTQSYGNKQKLFQKACILSVHILDLNVIHFTVLSVERTQKEASKFFTCTLFISQQRSKYKYNTFT